MRRAVRVEQLFCDICWSEQIETPAPVEFTARLNGHVYAMDACTEHARSLGHRLSTNASDGQAAPPTSRAIPKATKLSDTPTQTIKPDRDGTFACPDCDEKGFTKRAALGSHRRIIHGIAGTSRLKT